MFLSSATSRRKWGWTNTSQEGTQAYSLTMWCRWEGNIWNAKQSWTTGVRNERFCMHLSCEFKKWFKKWMRLCKVLQNSWYWDFWLVCIPIFWICTENKNTQWWGEVESKTEKQIHWWLFSLELLLHLFQKVLDLLVMEYCACQGVSKPPKKSWTTWYIGEKLQTLRPCWMPEDGNFGKNRPKAENKLNWKQLHISRISWSQKLKNQITGSKNFDNATQLRRKLRKKLWEFWRKSNPVKTLIPLKLEHNNLSWKTSWMRQRNSLEDRTTLPRKKAFKTLRCLKLKYNQLTLLWKQTLIKVLQAEKSWWKQLSWLREAGDWLRMTLFITFFFLTPQKTILGVVWRHKMSSELIKVVRIWYIVVKISLDSQLKRQKPKWTFWAWAGNSTTAEILSSCTM